MMCDDIREQLINGFNTIDCSVRDQNIFYFVLREDYNSWNKSKRWQEKWNGDSDGPSERKVKKKVLVWLRRKPDEAEQWSHEIITGIYKMFGEVCTKLKVQFVGITDTVVYSIGSGEAGLEKDIPM